MEFHADWDFIVSSAGLLSLATLAVCYGAFESLPSSPPERTTSEQSLLEDEDEDEDERDIAQHMSPSDAWRLPIMCSVALFGLYLVITYVGKEWLNWILGWYFSIVGVCSVWRSAVLLTKRMIGKARWSSFDRNRILFLRGPLQVVSLGFRTPTMVLLPVAILPCILYKGSRESALLTNVFALSFAHNALSILRLDSFKTGCIMLTGLFVYDIYWVFGTEVMLKVASSVNVPMALIWPRTERGVAMLGLGDVVAPGFFVTLALRYDHARARKGEMSFSKPYFWVTLTAYVVGLMTAMTVMHTLGKGQPALLYVSPACILSLMAMGVVRGEVGDVWKWSDDPKERRGWKGSRGMPVEDDENGKCTAQPNRSADGGHAGAEGTEGDGEGGASEDGQEGVQPKKRKNRGRKKA